MSLICNLKIKKVTATFHVTRQLFLAPLAWATGDAFFYPVRTVTKVVFHVVAENGRRQGCDAVRSFFAAHSGVY